MKGDYGSPPIAGLKAFGRVYAGWAYSQAFYREELYRNLGFENAVALLCDWEQDHLAWDANNLQAKHRAWQHGDISNNELYNGNFELALDSIRARAILIPCRTDLYFPSFRTRCASVGPESGVYQFPGFRLRGNGAALIR